MKYPSAELIAHLRETYKNGMRVVLVISMDDPYTKLQVGDKGTIDRVDDAGGIHINWDNGEELDAIWGEDVIRFL
jgi:hypothetical protein